MSGNTNETGDVGGSPGKSSLFFLTVKELGGNTRLFFDTPWNRIDRRYGILTGKAAHLCVLSGALSTALENPVA
jgi:hypothetical protein